MLNEKIIKEIRLIHGMTQKEFAQMLRIPQPFLSQIERQLKPAPELLLARLRKQFNVPEAILQSRETPYSVGDLNFRTKKISAAVQEAVRITFSWTERTVRATLRQGSYAQVNLDGFKARRTQALPREAIEEAASVTRTALNLSTTGVIRNVTRALEGQGLPVTLLENPLIDFGAVDGVSSPYAGERPIIAVTEQDAGDRARFTRAHELGHIVLHQSYRPSSEAIREEEANLFAGAFLVSQDDAYEVLKPSLTPTGYAHVKAQYGVSIAALIRRAFTLGIIDSHRYRSLMIQLSSRGWRTHEPVEVPVETTRLIPKVDLGLNRQSLSAFDYETSGVDNVINLFGSA